MKFMLINLALQNMIIIMDNGGSNKQLYLKDEL